MTIFSSLFAALIAVGAFIAIPIGPVPIVLQNFFVLLAALTLNWRWAIGSVGVYLLAGVIGLPVFSGGRGGLGHLMGPTGGYLLSYLPAVWIVSYLNGFNTRFFHQSVYKRTIIEVGSLLLGSIIIYGIGVSWLKTLLGVTWSKSIALGVTPFILGDLIKIAIVIPVARYTRKLVYSNAEPNAIQP